MIERNDSCPACADTAATRARFGPRPRGAAGLRGCGAVAHRVPDLELDLLVVYRDHARTKLDADGEVMHWLEALVRELQEQARLPDAGVADDDVPARTQGAALTLAGSPDEGGV